jgi:hypothetical protein
VSDERKAVVRTALVQEGQARDEDLAAATLTKYAAVVEWMDAEGTKWLSIVSGDAGDDEHGLQRWDVQGMFFNVLHDPAWYPEDEQ